MTEVAPLLDVILREWPPLSEFADESKLARGRSSTQLNIRDGEVYVNLYMAGDGGIIVVG